jgi:small subunit ribosomal protein S29
MYFNAYHKKCYHHWRPDDIRRVGLDKGLFKGFNTGGLLWGNKGCGKSQVLAYLTAWAHENEWVNITVPSCSEFVDATHDTERMENGMYVQHSLATRMLSDMAIQNEQIFRECDVNMSRYGQFDISGVSDADGDPQPRTWDPLRQCWSDDWKNFLYD